MGEISRLVNLSRSELCTLRYRHTINDWAQAKNTTPDPYSPSRDVVGKAKQTLHIGERFFGRKNNRARKQYGAYKYF